MKSVIKRIPFDLEKAKNGAKIVTRSGLSVRRVDVDVKDNDHPILCLVTWKNGKETPILYTMNGRYCPDHADDMDLFIEEEVAEEHNNFEIMPDKWYLCTREACLWLEDGINYTSFMKGVSYLGADILKCNLSFEHEFYQNYFRYWDIKDAKDGDVLHSTGLHNDCIFIFNGLDNWKFDEPDGDRAVATGYCCLFVAADKMEFGIQGPDCIEVNTTTPATQAQRDLLFQEIKEAGYKWDSDKKELKKIESKFHKGDWVIDKQGIPHQITNVVENVTNHTYGYDTTGGYFLENVKGAWFWSIQEAKNGEVLTCHDCIVLFKEIDGLNIKCHCAYHFFYPSTFFVDTLQNKRAFYPATQEQCDLLYKKIKEEGYEWDEEKKELKKIEEVKKRRMTNQELAWWLRDSPEEHREFMITKDGAIFDSHIYYIEETNEPVKNGVVIRRNGGEWQEPLSEL